jgi:isoquinoline 1-oxidoreductase beta subunit
MKTKNKWRISRRGFLIGAGVLGGGVALGYVVGLPYARRRLAEAIDTGGGPGRLASIESTPTTWIEVKPDNTVVFNIPKIEMGQGIHTALAQILAEELGASWEQTQVVQNGTTFGPQDSVGTAGSRSVSALWLVLREVAANMREMLRADAAKILGKPAAEVRVMDGAFSISTKTLTFGEVVAQHTGAWEAPKDKPTLKPISEFKIVGQPMPRVDLPSKIVGEAIYAYDVRLPGLLYGAIAMPPTIEGKLRSAAAGTAEGQPGVVKVVIEKDFAGVVAKSRQQAAAGVSSLALDWDEGKLWSQSEVEALLDFDERKSVVIQADGGATAQPGGNVIEARYSSPFAAHAHLEPQAAVVDVQADKAQVWVGTQLPAFTRGDVAEALGFKEEQVEIIPTYLGGGFGRKYGSDVAVAAAKLSKAAGKPVHVGWVRKQEFQNGYLRPPTRHILRGSLNGAGQIESIAHLQSSGEVARAFLPAAMMAVLGADFGATRGARWHYDGIAKRFASAQLATLPIRTGWWRGLGLLANTFAMESFVDELAHAAKVDPLQFRLNHLSNTERDTRQKAVLKAVAEKAEWGKPWAAGHAKGIAACTDAGTACAQVAEVSVDADKQIRVHKVWSAIDPGFIINPDGVRAQTEGAITMGISSTLIEEARIENGRVNADNFDAYPLITMRDTPEIDVVLLQSGSEPKGVGEPPIGPIAAAIGNAVFALTGQRLRELPLRL